MTSGSSRKAECSASRERRAVHADFSLADQAVLAFVHEFDRILDRQDVTLHPRVHVVDHRRERRRLARARLAGDQDQPIVDLAEVAHGIGHVELIERQRLRRNRPTDAAKAVQVAHDVDAKTRHAGNDVREVGAVLFLEPRERRARHDLVQRFFHDCGRQRLSAQVVQLAVQAHARRVTCDEMQVRAALAQHVFQELIDRRGRLLAPVTSLWIALCSRLLPMRGSVLGWARGLFSAQRFTTFNSVA